MLSPSWMPAVVVVARSELCAALECDTVPPAEIGAGRIRGIAEREQCGARRRRFAHVVVHQQELAELRIITGGVRLDAPPAQTSRLLRRIRIERSVGDIAATGPKAHAADFVRVRLTRDRIGAWTLRRSPAGESRNG